MFGPEVLIDTPATLPGGDDITALLMPGDYTEMGGDPNLGWIYATGADGSDLDEASAAIETVIAGYPTVRLHDRDELRAAGDVRVDVGVRVFHGLIGLLIVIALFGIVNTLALSITERVREIGLLRAIGMTRGGVRAMVSAEAVVIAAIGALVGIALGVVFCWAMFDTATPGIGPRPGPDRARAATRRRCGAGRAGRHHRRPAPQHPRRPDRHPAGPDHRVGSRLPESAVQALTAEARVIWAPRLCS